MKLRIKKIIISSIISFFLLIIACGGGGDGGSNGGGLQEPLTDLSGIWSVQETQNGNCEESIYPQYETYIATVGQTGNDINMTYTSDSETHNISGTISGSNLTWEETRTDDDSTTSINFSGTVSDDGDTITGSATWTWTDDSYTCSGTTEITATRVTESSVNVTGTWEGTWQSPVHSLSGTFTTNIEQQSSTLSGSIDVPEIGMFDANLKGTVDGNIITFGDIEDRITFTGTVAIDSSSGTYVYPSLNDNGTWQATKGSSNITGGGILDTTFGTDGNH